MTGERPTIGWVVFTADMDDPAVSSDNVAGGVVIDVDGDDTDEHRSFTCVRVFANHVHRTTVAERDVVTAHAPPAGELTARDVYRTTVRSMARSPSKPHKDAHSLETAWRAARIAAGL